MPRFTVAVSAAALLSGGLALADPPKIPDLPPLPASLPERCQVLAQLPASATIPDPEIAAHVSVANCLAEVAMNAQVVSASDTSIARLGSVVTPSLAILDDVIQTSAPYWKLIAQDAKRDLYNGLVVRERSSIAGGDVADHDQLEPKLAAWQAEATKAEVAMAELGRAHPELGRQDAVIARVLELLPAERHPQMAKSSR